MKIRAFVFSSILLAVGFVLHALVPGIGTMKPDFLLAMMILAIVINPSFALALSTGFIAGILSGMTSVFPGGQFLSMFDKMAAALIVYSLIGLTRKMKRPYNVIVISAVGTLISGLVFLVGACFLMNMGTAVFSLVYLVVLPTVLLNSILNVFIYQRVMMRLHVVPTY